MKGLQQEGRAKQQRKTGFLKWNSMVHRGTSANIEETKELLPLQTLQLLPYTFFFVIPLLQIDRLGRSPSPQAILPASGVFMHKNVMMPKIKNPQQKTYLWGMCLFSIYDLREWDEIDGKTRETWNSPKAVNRKNWNNWVWGWYKKLILRNNVSSSDTQTIVGAKWDFTKCNRTIKGMDQFYTHRNFYV